MKRALCTVLLVVAAVALPAPGRAESLLRDKGVYEVSQRGRTLGTEAFSFDVFGDSLLVFSDIRAVLPRADRVDSLEKSVVMVLDSLDLELLGYESHARLNGQRLSRLLDLRDTVVTAIMESDRGGLGNCLRRPPGRLFVLDPQAFVLFDVILRSLHGSSLDERSVNVLFLGMRDSVIAVNVRRLGVETIQWGARPVQAQKYSIADNASGFLAWVGPTGKMLRLTEPTVGLRVERTAPVAKRPQRPKQSSGG